QQTASASLGYLNRRRHFRGGLFRTQFPQVEWKFHGGPVGNEQTVLSQEEYRGPDVRFRRLHQQDQPCFFRKTPQELQPIRWIQCEFVFQMAPIATHYLQTARGFARAYQLVHSRGGLEELD